MTDDLYEVPKLWREDGMQECQRFPVAVTQVLTLRDQFAMAALTGLLSNGAVDSRACVKAYGFADAMLEARKEKK